MSGVAIQYDTSPIRPPGETPIVENAIFCPCDFRCDFEEKVFASDEADEIKNDITDFLFKKITASDTIVIELLKSGITKAIITDNTFGDYYFGFDNQPLYVGWQADWTKIFNAFSGGQYQVKVTTTILGAETVFLSRYFRLNTYDELSANNTIKIQTIQNGKFQNTGFDFTNLIDGGWPTSIRIEGSFGEMQPNLERDIFQDNSYREIQNRDKVIREYRLTANKVPADILNRIATTESLANQIFITSYNVLQGISYEKYPVVVESFNETRYDNVGNTHFEVTLSDRQKNIIKTNVS